ncbi:MAG: hypothetical protein ACE5K3_00970 [bacterium]
MKVSKAVINLDDPAQGGQPNWLHEARLQRQREKEEMPKRKEERNRRFWRDWKQKGLSNKELSLKYGLSPESVKSLKKVLKLRYDSEN